jgi:chromosome segregation protein
LLQFTKLRLTGFKSFVEPTELLIEPGLTGIVGPNGCGKSNLVEALRWVMGESSAKQMRGGEMDDVIFGGTADKPLRNIAEVVLELDNSGRFAPPPFDDSDRLDVARRIERAKGSVYRVNGKELRARDVQLLFADAATGARSAALVSQGRIGALIAAKPADRRALLEEAAGISGLHSRRHEAELRLRAAETNLERVDDVLVTLETQLQSLKKQARQATRYRNLSAHIRKSEATFFYLRWRAAEQATTLAKQRLEEAEAAVSDLTGRAAAAAAGQAEAAAALPDLRRAEAEAAAALQRLIIARDGLDAEERRIESDREACRLRLAQIAADLERERTLAADAESAMARLEADRGRIEAACHGEEEARADAATTLQRVIAEVETHDIALSELTERVASHEARRTALSRTAEELDGRRQRLTARAADIARQRTALEAEEIPDIAAVEAAVAAARSALESARSEVETTENRRAVAANQATAAVAASQAADGAVTRLRAEERALAEVIETGASDQWTPMLDAVTVEPGMEIALAAALGDDLSAPADESAPVHWRHLPPSADPPPLPAAARPLADFVRGPAVLERRLSQVGIIADDADGNALQPGLRQGQRLVTREGALWRWDGYAMSAGAVNAAAVRLEQRNRLAEVRRTLTEATSAAASAERRAAEARIAAEAAVDAAQAARRSRQAADAAYERARETHADVRQRVTERTSRLTAIGENETAIAAELAETEINVAATRSEIAALPDLATAKESMAGKRAELAELRASQMERQAALDGLLREAAARRRRLQAIAGETDSWRTRSDAAGRQIDVFRSRQQATETESRRLSVLPGEIAGKRQALLNEIEIVEQRRRAAADQLATAETRLADADRAVKAAEGALLEARENRVRAEGAVEQAEQAGNDVAERIDERLDVSPAQLADIAGIAADDALPELEAEERRLERLRREREVMGPVNLRAEQEAAELTEQMQTLDDQRRDLIEAIGKLRRGIAELDREGRERLLASFADVDRHFRELFMRLFGGGRAHLTLTDSDNPLEAGLEIMASPPGKRLQVLSLLSGGEQALTALALIFAVFLTNPAPICVLDEVDAPLDDANVDRFCGLLTEMAEGGTRFLVITHHRMSMARMDRLFGVTMAERGVSQLVSVDLQRAEELRQTA